MVVRKDPLVTKGRKFNQVLEGARSVFLRQGFAGASVDDIASEAGVSKATLYSYFPDKELMFSEVFRADLALDRHEPMMAVAADRPAAEALPAIIEALARQMVSAAGVKSYRMRVGEAGRFPHLAQEFLDTAHRSRRAEICKFLERWARRGEVEIDDLELATDQLIALAASMIRDRAVFLGSDSVSEAQIRRVTAGAAQVFIAAYGAGYGGATDVASRAVMSGRDRAKTVPPME